MNPASSSHRSPSEASEHETGKTQGLRKEHYVLCKIFNYFYTDRQQTDKPRENKKGPATPYIGYTLNLCGDLPGEARVLLLLPFEESQPEALRRFIHQVPDAGQLWRLAAAGTQRHFVNLRVVDGRNKSGWYGVNALSWTA